MKNQWYCGVEGQQYGPYTWEQLRAMAAEGRIVTDSYVRRDVDQQWFQAAQVPGLLPKAPGGAKRAAGDPSKSTIAGKRPKAAAAASASHSSGNIPVGQPVAAAPAVVAVAPVGVAVAAAPATAVPVFAPQVVAAPPVAPTAAEPPAPAKKGGNPLLLVGILGGACALVAVIGIGVLVWSMTRAAKTAEEEIAGTMDDEMRGALEQMASELQENPPAELNPQALASLEPLANEMQKALRDNLDKTPKATTAPASDSAAATSPLAAQKVLKSIPRWTDVTQLRAVELNKLKLSVASAWVASDQAGTRTDPAAGAAAGKYVFVELRITNVAPVARKYQSWNAAGPTAAVLADQSDAIMNLVPPSSTPAAKRLSTVEVQPGQSVTDVLVFSAPASSVEKLHLALAKSAFAENAKFRTGSHFALEIPLEVLLASGASSPAAATEPSSEPIAANQAASLDGDQPPPIIGQTQPPPGEAAPAKPVEPVKKVDRPPTREELNKQFEELSKEEGKPEEKKGEAQK